MAQLEIEAISEEETSSSEYSSTSVTDQEEDHPKEFCCPISLKLTKRAFSLFTSSFDLRRAPTPEVMNQ